MLIVTADDYGRSALATDRILECFLQGCITSASAMVFMADSERAAALARETSLEVGLHVNLTEALTGPAVSESVRRPQARVARYLNWHRYAQVLYNPFLRSAFRVVVQSQRAEFERLYGRPPDFVNGHHHMHLAANVLGQRLLPVRCPLRGPFTFRRGQKGRINLWYRARVARQLRRAFVAPDRLYSIEPIADLDRLHRIAAEAAGTDVELEVHPEELDQQQFLLSRSFHELLGGAPLGGFRRLKLHRP